MRIGAQSFTGEVFPMKRQTPYLVVSTVSNNLLDLLYKKAPSNETLLQQTHLKNRQL